MTSPVKRKVSSHLKGLEPSPGFQQASKSRESLPDLSPTALESGSRTRNMAKKARYMQEDEDDEDEALVTAELDESPSRSRGRGQTSRATRSDQPDTTPTKPKTTPAKSTAAPKEMIFLTDNDPRLKAKATPKTRGRVASGTTPTGQKSTKKERHTIVTKKTLSRSNSINRKGKGKEILSDDEGDFDDTPVTPSKSRVKQILEGATRSGASSKKPIFASGGRRSEVDEETEDGRRSRSSVGYDLDEDGVEMVEEENEEEEPEEEDFDESDEEEDGLMPSPSKSANKTASKAQARLKGKEKDAPKTQGFITQTSFDLYFQTISQSVRTSNNVFSNLLPSLTLDKYTSLLSLSPVSPIHHPNANPDYKHAEQIHQLHDSHRAHFGRYLTELREGFNLLFYGFGSKREILNDFARDVCSKVGDVVVLNGFKSSVGIKDLLNHAEKVMEGQRGGRSVDEEDIASSAVGGAISGVAALTPMDAQALRIYRYYLPPRPKTSEASSGARSSRPLFLMIHSIDSPSLRSPKVRSILGLLASNPRIHLIGSVDHMNAPLIWTQSEASGRGHDAMRWPGANASDEEIEEDDHPRTRTRKRLSETSGSTPGPITIPSERNFTWLWHDLTTFSHYDVELRASGKDLTSLVVSGSGRTKAGVVGGGAGQGAAGTAGPLTEAGAHHVLTSVTERSRNVFIVIAEKQLANVEAELDGVAAAEASTPSGKKIVNVPVAQMNRYAVSYDHLFTVAREKFYATSDQGLRGLLREFQDHGMVLSGQLPGRSGEVVWIPLSKAALEKLLEEIQEA